MEVTKHLLSTPTLQTPLEETKQYNTSPLRSSDHLEGKLWVQEIVNNWGPEG